MIGSIPEWLPLGPVIEIDGLPAREVLGTWKHLNECDRPPKYIREDDGVHNCVTGFDRSETRKPIKQNRPGRHVSELRGIHSGACAILFNGPSMAAHDLHGINVPIIGMNRTHQGFVASNGRAYDGPQPDYLCIVDWAWFDRPKWRETVLKHPKIINGSDHQAEIGWRVVRHPRMAPFSFDLERDGYAGPIPCTTGHLALQIAVWMGFTELYCLGWDLSGPHFDATAASIHFADAIRYHKRQAVVLKEHGIKVYLCGSPESKLADTFEHASFEEISRRAA